MWPSAWAKCRGCWSRVQRAEHLAADHQEEQATRVAQAISTRMLMTGRWGCAGREVEEAVEEVPMTLTWIMTTTTMMSVVVVVVVATHAEHVLRTLTCQEHGLVQACVPE